MEHIITDLLTIVNLEELAYIFIKIVIITSEIGNIIKLMAMESFIIMKELSIKENGSKMSSRE